MHVYVIVTYDRGTQQGDTAGAFTSLEDARAEAIAANVNLRDAGIDALVAIETWEGPTFMEQRTLEQDVTVENTAPDAKPRRVWKLSQAPSWAPFKETR